MLSGARPAVAGGGATAAAPIAATRAPRAFTREQLAARTDALALAVGTRFSASALLLACVVVLLLGAQSLLATMEAMDRDIKEMGKQMAISNGGLDILNETMDSVPPTARHLSAIVGTVEETSSQVKVSSERIESMAGTTQQLGAKLESIAGSTTRMRGSLENAATGTTQLSSTIDTLNRDIGPLVGTQHQMLLGTRRMRGGLDSMNQSLAYTIRIMNYIAAPPTGGGMTIRADLPKSTLPPLPGMRAEVKPVQVFDRNVWSIYEGP